MFSKSKLRALAIAGFALMSTLAATPADAYYRGGGDPIHQGGVIPGSADDVHWNPSMRHRGHGHRGGYGQRTRGYSGGGYGGYRQQGGGRTAMGGWSCITRLVNGQVAGRSCTSW